MWIIVDMSQSPVLVCMDIQRWDSLTLLPVIQALVAPGTVVHTDGWLAYSGLGNLPSVSHSTVNHSNSFVDSGLEFTLSLWCPIGTE